MSGVTIKPNGLVYNAVNQQLKDMFDADFSETEVLSVAKAAMSRLKEKGSSAFKKWDKKSIALDDHQQRRLNQAVKKVIVSPKTPWNPNFDLPEDSTQQIFLDVMRGNVQVKDLLKDKLLLKAVAWKKNPELLEEGRDLVTSLLEEMMENIDQLSTKESFHLEMIIGDLLALYPFLGPESGEVVNVPVRMNGEWKLVSYNVEKINLTPDWMGSPLTAVGLVPRDPEAGRPPLLLFKGTTFPTDDGFSLSLITDLTPGVAVGASAFQLGRKKIKAWLEKHASQNKAVIYGKSLGGALSTRTAMNFSGKVQKVMAYGAPGLTLRDQRKWKSICKDEAVETPEMNMFCQKGDSVLYFDGTVKNFNYYQVVSSDSRSGVAAHAHMYSVHESNMIVRMSQSKITSLWKRVSLTALRVVLSLVAFPVLVVGHAAQTGVKKVIRAVRLKMHPQAAE